MWIVGILGYAGASIAYAIFAIMLFAARNKTPVARWLLICAFVMVFANGFAAAQMEFSFTLQWVMALDSLKIACWSILILSFNSEHKTIAKLLKDVYIKRYLSTWLALVVSSWVISFWLNYTYDYIFLLFVALNLWTLVLLEQVYRSANSHIRWALWPLVIGLATMSVFDFVLYAQAIMVKSIDFDFWFGRGLVAMLIMPMLLLSTRRIKEGSVRIFVSRQVVFYSSMLMIAGIYLLIMSLAGYLLKYLGGAWGDLISILFLFFSGIVLVVLLITETLRRKLRVFIAKNFFANKYEYRDEWLQLIGVLEESSVDDYYQKATHIMMSKLDASAGAIIKRQSLSQFEVKYTDGVIIDESLNEDLVLLSQFCQQQGWIVDINDYANEPESYPSLFIQPNVWQERGLTIIVPIFIGKNFYGLFVLSVGKDKETLNWEDRDLLFAISKQLGNFVSLHEANEKIAQSKQFDAFSRMSAFLVHDLKNVQAQLELITTNAVKHRSNPEFVDDVFETVESATERLSKVLSQLRNKQVAKTSSQCVELADSLNKVVKQRNVNLPVVSLEAEQGYQLMLDVEMFESVINHLIQNAQEASKDDGWVKVNLSATGKCVQIAIEDNGCGMSADFITHRLFTPFDTTKGNAGMGIGVYEAKQFFNNLAGEIQVESTVGEGTKMVLILPQKLCS